MKKSLFTPQAPMLGITAVMLSNDIYKQHASKLFKLPESQVTAEQRIKAKIALYQKMYTPQDK